MSNPRLGIAVGILRTVLAVFLVPAVFGTLGVAADMIAIVKRLLRNSYLSLVFRSFSSQDFRRSASSWLSSNKAL